jgi:hypothetical protein
MIGGEQYEKRNARGEGCGKNAPWKSPKADFSTRLEIPQKTRDSHLCAEHVRQFEGESPFDNLMEVKS